MNKYNFQTKNDHHVGNYNNNYNNNNYNNNSNNVNNHYYNSNATKKMLVDYIYSNIDLSKYRYKLLEKMDDLNIFKLSSNNFYISANFSGYNYMMIFCKIKDKNYSYMIDRKNLSFYQNQLNYNNITIYPINLNLDQSIYNGTIIDGTLIKNEKKNDKVFVITDLYLFKGENTENDKLNHKLLNITSYLEHNLHNTNNNFTLTVNKLLELNDIDTLINEDIKNTKDFHVRGICFFPEISGTKLIYVFTDTDKSLEKQKVTNINNYNVVKVDETQDIKEIKKAMSLQAEIDKKKTIIKYIPKNTKKDIMMVMELRKTPVIDVYKIFIVEEFNKDGKQVLRTKKMGIAYIPTKETSNLCKDIINKTSSGKALFNCKFDMIKLKWVPVSECTDKKIPSKLSELENKLDILEETDDEDD